MLILDTHVWWWALSEPGHLSVVAGEVIDSVPRDQLAISSISIWELSLLFSRGKIELKVAPEEWFEAALQRVEVIPLSPTITLGAYRLPGEFHRDPADRMIVATARCLGGRLVSKDRAIRNYEFVETVW